MTLDTQFLTSSLEMCVCGSRTIQTPTTSPYFASGTATAAASRISGCAVNAFSIWTGNKF